MDYLRAAREYRLAAELSDSVEIARQATSMMVAQLSRILRSCPELPDGEPNPAPRQEPQRYVHSHKARNGWVRGEFCLPPQEAPLFDEAASEAVFAESLSFANVRETAGWSAEASRAGPKMAALLAAAGHRAEIVDALHRFALGQDLADKQLFASSFTPDAELDFRPAAARWGGDVPVMSGRDTIVTTILAGFAGRVDTTHQVTNPRVVVDGDTARLTALVEAQHLLRADHDVFALLKNRYDVELRRDADRWLMRRVRIENVWYQGAPTAIFG